MQNYFHHVPTKLYFGKGQICHLAESLDTYGKNVLLVYGPLQYSCLENPMDRGAW